MNEKKLEASLLVQTAAGLERPSRRAFLQGSGLAVTAIATGISPAQSAERARAAAVPERQPFPNADIGYLSARELSAAYRSGALSPVEVLNGLYERIAAINPVINAFLPGDHSLALRAARESEARWRKNMPWSTLDGVPVSIKGYLDVRGLPIPRDRPSAAGSNPVADSDNPAVENLRAGGAIIFGKSTMPEIGVMHGGANTFYGPVHNPWDLSKTSGGSSSGAAAAAAAGLGPIHIGSDGGGSVRGPASYCGLFGLKASQYRVAQSDWWNGWECFGPLTRDPGDAAMAMNLMVRANPRSSGQVVLSWRDEPSVRASLRLKEARVGFCPWVGDNAPRISAEHAAAAKRVLTLLESCGAATDLVGPFVPDGFWEAGTYGDVVVPALKAEFAAIPSNELDTLSPWHRAILRKCAEVSDETIRSAADRFSRLKKDLVNPLHKYDYLVVQQFSGPVQAVEAPWPDYAHVDSRIAFAYDYALPFWIFNYLGLPAISIPTAFSNDGLPMGVQIVGRLGTDEELLRIAGLLSHDLAPTRPWPFRFHRKPQVDDKGERKG